MTGLANAGLPWRPEDEKTLYDEYMKATHPAVIADVLKRTQKSVEMHMQQKILEMVDVGGGTLPVLCRKYNMDIDAVKKFADYKKKQEEVEIEVRPKEEKPKGKKKVEPEPEEPKAKEEPAVGGVDRRMLTLFTEMRDLLIVIEKNTRPKK
jgi:hypothetical protein